MSNLHKIKPIIWLSMLIFPGNIYSQVIFRGGLLKLMKFALHDSDNFID